MKRAILAFLLALAATPALAHTGVGEANGFVHGLEHPIFGPDHLLAMLAVGMWSGFVLPKRFWMGAATFMGAMAVGAGISWSGIAIPMVETWIVLSVVVFGVLTLVSRRGQPEGLTQASLAAIALFALCHGHAHATEASGHDLAYLVGFLISTGALHVVGILIARAIAEKLIVQRALGAGIAASGLYLMVG